MESSGTDGVTSGTDGITSGTDGPTAGREESHLVGMGETHTDIMHG